jgi:4-hydroxybenzoate polyprenyltransferase
MNKYLSLIKFSHTIFALPFALLGFFLASFKTGQTVSAEKLLLIIGCMVTARSAAMAFNRFIDRDIDKQNTRTAIREIPSGEIKSSSALIFVIINALLFIVLTYFINSLCFYLSPVALAVILGYSLTKRFTLLCHLVLGIGLALAPIGAYLAVTGTFNVLPILLGCAVLCWVAGFDIIYALQDEDFDKANQLHSIPSYFGKEKALNISRGLHLISATILAFAVYQAHGQYATLQYLSYGALVFFILLLIYQHTIVKANDLSKINLAFFTTNGVASLIFGTLVILDFYV